MEENTIIKYDRLYRRICVISICTTLLFIACFYSQAEYPDYYVNPAFSCAVLFEIIYGGILFGRNKGLLGFSIDKSKKDNVLGGCFAIVSVLIIGASFIIHGYSSYIIQNVLYVSAIIVLPAGLAYVNIKNEKSNGSDSI